MAIEEGLFKPHKLTDDEIAEYMTLAKRQHGPLVHALVIDLVNVLADKWPNYTMSQLRSLVALGGEIPL